MQNMWQSYDKYKNYIEGKNLYIVNTNFYHTIAHIQDLLGEFYYNIEGTLSFNLIDLILKDKYAVETGHTFVEKVSDSEYKYSYQEKNNEDEYVTKYEVIKGDDLLKRYKFEHKSHLLALAILYHDAFYKPGFQGNEHISACIADFELRNYLNNEDREYVCNLIMSTKADYDFSEIKSDYSKIDYLILHDLDWKRFSKPIADIIEDDNKVLNETVSSINNDMTEDNKIKYVKRKQREFYSEWHNKFEYFILDKLYPQKYNTAIVKNNMELRFVNIV